MKYIHTLSLSYLQKLFYLSEYLCRYVFFTISSGMLKKTCCLCLLVYNCVTNVYTPIEIKYQLLFVLLIVNCYYILH